MGKSSIPYENYLSDSQPSEIAVGEIQINWMEVPGYCEEKATGSKSIHVENRLLIEFIYLILKF